MANEAKMETTQQSKEFHATFMSDRQIYRATVTILGAIAIISVIGAIILAAVDAAVPESVISLGSAATGGLVGLFAEKPTG